MDVPIDFPFTLMETPGKVSFVCLSVTVPEIVMLCANCHRMVHKKRPWLTMTNLEMLLKKDKNGNI